MTRTGGDILAWLSAVLEETHPAYCVIGGVAVSAYAEPFGSLDLVTIAEETGVLRAAGIGHGMKVLEGGHSLNVSAPASDLRIHVRNDPRYQEPGGRAIRQRAGV